MRLATFWLVGLLAVGACNDVRDFAGDWHGNRVGDSPVLRVGDGDSATLTVDTIDKHGLRGHVAVAAAAGTLIDTDFESLEAAEADAVSSMTFAGAPLRVYMAFVPVSDGAGDALAMISLYDSRRIELRLMRGSPQPLYAIFPLGEAP